MILGTYSEAMEDKALAAKIILPLIEFEFCFLGQDSPELVQASANRSLLDALYKICKQHRWTTPAGILKKGDNFYFRIAKTSFAEIYLLAGPFISDSRNEWAKLVIERSGKKGGYMVGKEKTEDKVLKILKNKADWCRVEELCLSLRLLPSVIRTAIRLLNHQGLLLKKRVGKVILWRVK